RVLFRAGEHPRRGGLAHARGGDRTVDADGELDLDLARGGRAQRVGRIARRRRADRTQLGGRGRGAARGLGLAAFGFQTLGLAARGFLARRLLACALLPRRLFLRGLLRGQFARCLFLGQALLLLALALELALALRLLFGGELLLGRTPRRLGLGAGDGGLEPFDRRVRRVGLLDQRQQALGLGEVAAVAALLGGDHGHRQQVDQRAGHAGVGRLLVAQGKVVLHRVVAAGRVQPALLVGLGRGLAQLLGVHGGDLGRSPAGRGAGGAGGGARAAGRARGGGRRAGGARGGAGPPGRAARCRRRGRARSARRPRPRRPGGGGDRLASPRPCAGRQ